MSDTVTPYDFGTLQTICPFDAVTLHVPARWHCSPMVDDSTRWVCGEDQDTDLETGTLWIRLDGYLVEPGGPKMTPGDLVRAGRDLLAACREKADVLENERVEETTTDFFFTYEEVIEEDGEDLRFYWHRRLVYSDWGPVLLLTNLVIADADKDDPAYRALARSIEYEVRHADITTPAHWMKTRCGPRVRALAALTLNNFDDRVKLGLPDVYDAHAVDDGAWRIMGDDGEPTVAIDVRIEAVTDDDGSPLDPEIRGRRIETLRAAAPAPAEATRLETAWIYHWTEDATAEASTDGLPAGPCRCFHWRHIHWRDGQITVLEVTMTLPAAHADCTAAQFLVRQMKREVREAQFPIPTEAADWDLPALELRSVEYGEGRVVQIPGDWRIREQDANSCWAQAADELADVKIQIDAGDLVNPPAGDGSSLALRQGLEKKVAGFLRNLKPVQPLEYDDIPTGRLIYGLTRQLEAGEPWLCYRWYMVYAFEQTSVLMRFILAMHEDLADTLRGRALVRHFGNQARRQYISTDEGREDPLADLRDINIDGRFVFRLPLAMVLRREADELTKAGRTLHAWYVSASDDRIKASMFIKWSENLFVYHDDGDLVDLPAEAQLASKIVTEFPDGDRFEPAADGWLFRDAWADEGDESHTPDPENDIDPDDWRMRPIRSNYWNYVHPIAGGFLDVDFLLMRPREPASPIDDRLLELMEREVAAVRFDPPKSD